MKFKLNKDEEIELKYSFRVNMYFENIQKKNVDYKDFSSEDVLVLFYCVVLATLQREKKPIIEMLEFMNIIDEYNGGEKCIIEFSQWYIDAVSAQYSVIVGDKEEKESKTTGTVVTAPDGKKN